jgi:microcystin-dependent protein
MSVPKQFVRDIDFLSTTESTNASGGSVRIDGGLGVLKNANFGSNVTIQSNLTVGNVLLMGNLYSSNGNVFISGQWGTNGSAIYYYNTAANSNVGINTTNPQYRLDISGSTRITNGSLLATFNSNTVGNLYTTGGNVGINNTSPAFPLDVVGNINFSGALYQNGSAYIGSQWSGTTGTVLYYGSSGSVNVGVGTTNPAYTIDVNGTGRFTTLLATNTTITNVTSTNLFGSNTSVGSLNVNIGITSSNLNSTNITTTNVLSTNITVSTLNSTGITTSSLLASTGISTGSILSTGFTTGAIMSTGLTTGNINFTGSLFQNGVAYLGSQWTGTTGTTLFYGTSGSVNVGIGTSNPSFNLDVNGTMRVATSITTGVIYATSSTITNVVHTNTTSTNINITNSSITNFVSTTGTIPNVLLTNVSASSLNITGITTAALLNTGLISTANIFATTATIPNISHTNLTSSTILATNITTTNLISTNVTTTNMLSTLITTSNLIATSGTVSNISNTNITTTNLLATTVTSTNLITTNVTTTNLLASNVTSTNMTTTNISTGTIQYTSATGINITTGTIVANTGISTATLLITGLTQMTNTTASTNSTSGAVNISGGLSLSNTNDTTSFTQGGALTVAGGVSIAKGLSLGSTISLGGVTTQFGGSFVASNNVISLTDVTGLLFSTANIRSFSLVISISIIRSAGGNLFTQYFIDGIQTDSGWLLDDYFIGDTSGVIFSITSLGQIQYLSSNLTNWTSSTFKYSATAYSISGNYTPTNPQTTGNYTITGILTITNSTGSSNSSNGSLIVGGGVGISQNLNVSGIISTGNIATTNITIGTLVGNVSSMTNIFATNITSSNLVTTNLLTNGALSAIYNSNTIGSIFTTGGNVGIATTSPVYNLDITGTMRNTGQVYLTGSNAIGITTNPSSTGTGSLNISGDIILPGGTVGNIFFTTAFVNPPTFTTRSPGTKVILYPSISASSLDFALGIENSHMWLSNNGGLKVYNNSLTPMLWSNSTGLSINTGTAPTFTLDVAGTARITTGITTGAIAATTYTGGNMQLSGSITAANIVVTGTLTTANTTTSNVINTNTTMSTLYVTSSIVSPSNTFGSSIITNMTAGGMRLGNGATSGISFGSGPYTNIYDNGNLHIWTDDNMFFDITGFSTAGNNIMYMNSTGVAIGNSAPAFSLDVTGSARFTSSITTGILSATSSTISNMVHTNVSTATLLATNNTLSNILSTNITTTSLLGSTVSSVLLLATNVTAINGVFTNISTGTFVGTSMNVSSLVASNISAANIQLSGNITVSNITVTGSLTTTNTTTNNVVNVNTTMSTLFVSNGINSASANTLGNIFTTGGNVGINTSNPASTLDVSGSIACTTMNPLNFTGMVSYFAMIAAPTGWLICDGSTISRATYANLFAAIGTLYGSGDGATTFKLPDLRGQFIRTYDNGAGVDASRIFGSSQSDAFQAHQHYYNDAYYANDGGTVLNGTISGSGAAVDTNNGFVWRQTNGSYSYTNQANILTTNVLTDGTTNGSVRFSTETRPINVALLACIKY